MVDNPKIVHLQHPHVHVDSMQQPDMNVVVPAECQISL